MLPNEKFWFEYLLAPQDKRELMLRVILAKLLCKYVNNSELKKMSGIMNSILTEATDVALCKP